jgi:hypothetical protein
MANTISTKEFRNRVVTKLKNVDKDIKAEDLYFNQTLKYRCITYKPNYPEQSFGDFCVEQNILTGEIRIYNEIHIYNDMPYIPIIRRFKDIDDFIENV